MPLGLLGVAADIVRRLVVWSEEAGIGFRIGIAHALVGVIAQGLVMADGPGDFLVHIGRDHLGAPIAVIGADQAAIGDVVQQAGQDHLFLLPPVQRLGRARQQVPGGDALEPISEEVQQGRLGRHARQGGIVAHHHHVVRVELGHELGFRIGDGRAANADRRGHDHSGAARLGPLRFTHG